MGDTVFLHALDKREYSLFFTVLKNSNFKSMTSHHQVRKPFKINDGRMDE